MLEEWSPLKGEGRAEAVGEGDGGVRGAAGEPEILAGDEVGAVGGEGEGEFDGVGRGGGLGGRWERGGEGENEDAGRDAHVAVSLSVWSYWTVRLRLAACCTEPLVAVMVTV